MNDCNMDFRILDRPKEGNGLPIGRDRRFVLKNPSPDLRIDMVEGGIFQEYKKVISPQPSCH